MNREILKGFIGPWSSEREIANSCVKKQGKLPYFRAGLISGQTEVSLICGSAWGISKEKSFE